MNIKYDELPHMYLATPKEIALQMKCARGGVGDTVLRENYTYKSGIAKGITDKLPDEWVFTKERADELFFQNAK